MKKVLVTGSSGLVGSEAVAYYDGVGCEVFGIDNNMRKEFFGEKGDTSWNLKRLLKETKNFHHCPIDIRDRAAIDTLFQENSFDLIIHCAAQPSHDKAKDIPLVDFDVNAGGTINLLEATRRHCPHAVFIFLSTNKVYGDAPNELEFKETQTRYDYAKEEDFDGISETCRIDRSLHSLFGASKCAADVIAQEYGRYFGLNVGVFRGGCLTGSAHSGVELHGFMSYIVHCAASGKPYTIFGYKGKQVRDQIHSSDVIQAMNQFAENPRPGEVYNLGGGRENSASILECIQLIEELGGGKLNYSYDQTNRLGDHKCYISDLKKFKTHYPGWSIKYSLKDIVSELCQAALV